jgi:hypothetical protein
MKPIDRFDPFNSRLCRNVRNALSEHFKTALEKKDLQPVHRIARHFLTAPQPTCVSDYIHNRLAAYESVVSELKEKDFADPVEIALVIWDRQLFFETHEFLEPHWMAATGDEKRFFQALIRAAGTYVHLEQGNLSAARRMAKKAIKGLTQGMARLAGHADPQRLLDKLNRLDPVPPVLAGTADPSAPSSER